MTQQGESRGDAAGFETNWSAQDRGDAESRMDVETSIFLRCHLSGDFTRARSWAGLLQRLAGKGFHLSFQDGRLALICNCTGVALCTCGFLGFRFAELAARLGKPAVLAGSGRLVALN